MNAITQPDTSFKLTPQQTAQAIIDLFTAQPDIHDQGTYISFESNGNGVLRSNRPLPNDFTMCTATAACYVNGYDVTVDTLLVQHPDDPNGDYHPLNRIASEALGLNHQQTRDLFLFSSAEQALDALRQIAQGVQGKADD